MSPRLRPASPPWPRSVRAELETTDWKRYPIVDIVTYAPATSRGLEGDRQHIEVYRYREAPSAAQYQTEERTARIERLTRPLYDRLLDE
ncbi:hypothetical protein HWV23_02190 [Natronomonas halophila]|uniref:hypothetical protein n=1 Tax=Natronomonas halophila TaxID=2747817 RepID=UPI0015B5C4C1|nr:hypothetical protein [Natronomonas halophila]QLD84566.1 hypothetical protein HWV23_02190 [Natronomonas halophila]